MSRRADAKAVARWEHDTRQWAIDTGRGLAFDLYYDRDRAVRPYGVRVVLDPGEKLWVRTRHVWRTRWQSGTAHQRSPGAPSQDSDVGNSIALTLLRPVRGRCSRRLHLLEQTPQLLSRSQLRYPLAELLVR